MQRSGPRLDADWLNSSAARLKNCSFSDDEMQISCFFPSILYKYLTFVFSCLLSFQLRHFPSFVPHSVAVMMQIPPLYCILFFVHHCGFFGGLPLSHPWGEAVRLGVGVEGSREGEGSWQLAAAGHAGEQRCCVSCYISLTGTIPGAIRVLRPVCPQPKWLSYLNAGIF